MKKCVVILFLLWGLKAFGQMEAVQLANDTLEQLQSGGFLALINPCAGMNSEQRPGKTGITLSLTNDNKFYGVWDYLIVGPENGGDDLGYTHGYLIAIDQDLGEGKHLRITHSNDLFGWPIKGASWKDESGENHVPQHFTEEIKTVATVDTKKQDRLFYLVLGGGTHKLVHEPSDSLVSSGKQQTLFHKFITNNTPLMFNDRIQVADGQGNIIGVIGIARIGIQKNLINALDGKVQYNVYAEAGVELSTISKASSIDVKVGNELSLKTNPLPIIGRLKAKAVGEVSESRHAFGRTTSPKIDLSLGTDNIQAGFEWKWYNGQLQNHVDYNKPHWGETRNDDTASLYIKMEF